MPFVIHDSTDPDVFFPADKGRGCVPRDYSVQPIDAFAAPPSEIKLIPRGEWGARCRELKERKARLSDVRRTHLRGRPIPSLDQGRSNYCWGHSTAMAEMVARAVMGLPHVALSAFAACATIMKGANEGGWCGLSAKFARERGFPSQEKWPQGDFDYRKHDRPEVWEDAARHKSAEDWADLNAQVWDQNLTEDMLATLLLSGVPCVGDYAWWGHSVCLLDWEEIEPGSFGPRGINSWGDGWGEQGEFTLQGEKKRTMGAIAILTSVAA